MVVMFIIAFLRHQVDVDALVAFTNSWWSMWENFLISWGSLSYVLSTGNSFFFVVITKSMFLKLQVWWFQTETVQRYNRLEIERVYMLSIYKVERAGSICIIVVCAFISVGWYTSWTNVTKWWHLQFPVKVSSSVLLFSDISVQFITPGNPVHTHTEGPLGTFQWMHGVRKPDASTMIRP